MAPEAAAQPLRLPVQIVGVADVSRLLREVDDLDDFIHQAELREAGHASPQLPRTSHLLSQLVESNQLNLLKNDDRARISTYLHELKLSAPTLHISFASDPPAGFVTKLVTWLRTNIHPQLLLQIGLEPTIAAGCIVRTTNHLYDFSLRRRFEEQRQLLIDKLGVSQ